MLAPLVMKRMKVSRATVSSPTLGPWATTSRLMSAPELMRDTKSGW